MDSKEEEPSAKLNVKLSIKKEHELFLSEPDITEDNVDDNTEDNNEDNTEDNANKNAKAKTKSKETTAKRKKTKNPAKNAKKSKGDEESDYDPTTLEYNSDQVFDRFQQGCECQDENCFRGLNADSVYRHRLNIAELTKAEHDMYLMGVTMACLTNPYETARHTERRRLRAQYVYQGRKVCLDAFLYLENCTHYQIKRIRKHLMTHGVTPRVHGNYGKVPHNTFSLDIYKNATEFLKEFVKKQEELQKTKLTKNAPLHLSADITRKTVHDLYKEYCNNMSPTTKALGYSTFRRFMNEQFSQVKFAKQDFVIRAQAGKNETEKNEVNNQPVNDEADVGNANLMQLVMASEAINKNNTYILTPVE